MKDIIGAYQLVLGHHYDSLLGTQTQQWVAGLASYFRSTASPFVIMAFYLIITYGLNLRFKGCLAKSTVIHVFASLHNLTLSLVSLVLLILMSVELFPWWLRGFHYSVCHWNVWNLPRLQMLYWLNSFTKLWEFVDTVLLIVRGKNLEFLHVYHHAMTFLLTWVQIKEHSTVAWVPIIANLFVHVVMYLYYFVALQGGRPWWRTWVTRLQIIQFIIDLAVCGYASFRVYLGDCNGTALGAFSGLFILGSYLVLFIQLYFSSNYNAKGRKAAIKSENASRSKQE